MGVFSFVAIAYIAEEFSGGAVPSFFAGAARRISDKRPQDRRLYIGPALSLFPQRQAGGQGPLAQTAASLNSERNGRRRAG